LNAQIQIQRAIKWDPSLGGIKGSGPLASTAPLEGAIKVLERYLEYLLVPAPSRGALNKGTRKWAPSLCIWTPRVGSGGVPLECPGTDTDTGE